MKRITMTLIAAMALAAAPLASAGPQEVQLSKTVRFADLDLSKPDAIESVYRRINYAAKDVCKPLEGRELWRISKHQRCVSEAMNNAVAQMNQPLLTQLHHARTGVATPSLAAR